MTQGVTTRSIDIAICTYRRETLRETLASVASQVLPTGTSIRVIVADNDSEPTARAMVDAVARQLGLACHYVHAPARNISIARNACLDAAAAPLLAFLDDDEVASSGWLVALLTVLDETGADAVLGPAVAHYPETAPHWAVAADLHSTRPVIRDGRILTGYTCNVLLRREVFAQLRFDPSLGRTGGEDDVFFAEAVARGASITYAPDAIVEDPVPETRLRLNWLLRRSFRNGQTYARVTMARGDFRLATVPTAAAKALACLVLALVRIGSPAGWRGALVRAALHVGALARYLGVRELELY